MTSLLPAGAVAFVARQPILDEHQRVCAYELLYRASGESRQFDGAEPAAATRSLLSNSLLTIGLDTLTAGKRAFINFPRELIVAEVAEMAPKDRVVIELLETVPPDAEVVAACKRLKTLGYQLALDDFVSRPGYEALLDLADIVKIDFRETTPEVQAELVNLAAGRKLSLLAEKVETDEEFRRARGLGYRYFQGYFFARPTVTNGKRPPGFQLNYERLLAEVYRPEVSFDRVAAVIKQELSLSYALLQYVNSACFGWSRRIESIQHAALLLGEQELQKWATLAIISAACTNKPPELVVLSMVRARVCENLARAAQFPSSGCEPFMTGLLSLLAAIVDKPLEKLLSALASSKQMRAALLGPLDYNEPLSALYHAALAYEKGDWSVVTDVSQRLGIAGEAAATAYREAVSWADAIFSGVGRPTGRAA